MKKCIKLLCLVVLLVNFIVIFPQSSLATDNFNFSRFDGEEYQNEKANNITKKVMGTALLVIRIVASGIAIIMLTYIAIKYMTAAPSERADFKKSAMIYVVGAVLVLGAQQILDVISKVITES